MTDQKIKNDDIDSIRTQVILFYELLKHDLSKLQSMKKEDDFVETYIYNYLERFCFAWISLDKLIPYMTKSPGFNYPVGILARSIVSDTIAAFYLTNSHNENTKVDKIKFKKHCKKLDFVFWLTKHDIAKELITDKNEFQKWVNLFHDQVKNLYSDFFPFDKDEQKRKINEKIDQLSITKMGKELNPKDRTKELLNLYRIYSQYEHSTFFTKSLQNNFDKQNVYYLTQTLQYSIKASIKLLGFINLPEASKEANELYESVKALRIKLFHETQ